MTERTHHVCPYGPARPISYLLSFISYLICDEHGVAEGEEAVFLLDGLLIGAQDVLPPRQRRHQHHQRGLRQVEIGDETVQRLELVARIDEDVRPARALL